MNVALEWCSIFDNVVAVRSNYDYQFNRLNKYLNPSSTKFFQSSNGDGNVSRLDLYDGTPERACDDLASSLLVMLVSPIEDKFNLVPMDKDQRDSKIHIDALKTAKNWVADHLTRPDTCFMKAASNVLRSVVGYGDGPFLMHRDVKKKLVKFAALAKQEVYFQRNQYGEVLNFFREVHMTPIQLKREFGDEKSGNTDERYWRELDEKIKGNPNEERKIINVVYEREDYEPKTFDGSKMKYASIWVDYERKVVLKESGFEYWPFYAPAWSLGPGEDYGRGPGHRALPDIITLNLMEKKNLAAVEVMITPPLIMPYDIMEDDIDLSPAAINYINLSRAMFGTQFIKPEPLNTIQNLPIGIEMQDRKRNQILLAFYNDILQDNKANLEQSATESNNTQINNIRKFGGPLSNLETDLVEPIIRFVFEAGVAFGEIELPDDMKDVKVGFTTAMHEAHQAIRLQALQNAAGILTQFASGGVQVQGLKMEELAPYVFKATGADTNLLEDPEVTKQKAQAAEQAQQDQVDAGSFKDAAAGLKDLNQAQQLI